MNINWKQKLTSRKFWVALAGFIGPLLLAFGVSDATATQVTGIIMAGASCVAYILGEGFVDTKRTSGDIIEDVLIEFDGEADDNVE